jgi:hypothetical protein
MGLVVLPSPLVGEGSKTASSYQIVKGRPRARRILAEVAQRSAAAEVGVAEAVDPVAETVR